MDFLKKHYEKISLAAVLIVLIVSAVLLSMKVTTLSSELAQPTPPPRRNQAISNLVASAYSNALLSLKQPPLWTNAPSDLFAQVASETRKLIIETNTFQVILMGVTRKPFKLLFKAYSYDADKTNAYNIQINFQFRARTFFVRAVADPIRDRYEDTGYKVVKFERKFTTVNDPRLGGQREKDVSEVTVQHEGENPVVLVYLQETEEQEPVATVRCGPTGTDREYRRGQRIECGGRVYKVIDIDPNQMIILDTQTEEQHIIKPQQ